MNSKIDIRRRDPSTRHEDYVFDHSDNTWKLEMRYGYCRRCKIFDLLWRNKIFAREPFDTCMTCYRREFIGMWSKFPNVIISNIDVTTDGYGYCIRCRCGAEICKYMFTKTTDVESVINTPPIHVCKKTDTDRDTWSALRGLFFVTDHKK